MRTGRGDIIIVEGHPNISAIKVHRGGGRHALPRTQITKASG